MDFSDTRSSSACAKTSPRGKFGEKRGTRYGIERAQFVAEGRGPLNYQLLEPTNAVSPACMV
jgi:hypothetical protein